MREIEMELRLDDLAADDDRADRFRGTFGCVGSDGEFYLLWVWANDGADKPNLLFEDEEEVVRLAQGRYSLPRKALQLRCDHPAAP